VQRTAELVVESLDARRSRPGGHNWPRYQQDEAVRDFGIAQTTSHDMAPPARAMREPGLLDASRARGTTRTEAKE
jgi:hypothetical protein